MDFLPLPTADKANILVIDDEKGPRESLRMILKPYFNVYTAENGEQAIQILVQMPIDLVTVDLKMPGLSGTNILEKVKEHDPDIEAIIITGYGSADTAIQALRSGAFDYITKPFDTKHVLALIRHALERSNARLKLRQIKESEKRRAEQAEEMARLKRQLVSALAHDIKNPLGLIMGYAEFLASRMEGRADAKEDLKYLSCILDSAQHIVKLVTGFLDASKVEAGYSSVRNPVQLNRLIRELEQEQSIALREKSLKFNLDLDELLPEIVGDKTQLERVLWNLVSNAVKFTRQGGEITVTSSLENNQVCVKVKDTGIGIPQNELPLLFSEFRRLRGSGKVEGTGLGLFIVKTIVEAHGGKVAVESKKGQGSIFSIRFLIEG